MVAPAYYDQSGQLIMGNSRGIGTPLRLISPAPILMNPGQQGGWSCDLNVTRMCDESRFGGKVAECHYCESLTTTHCESVHI